MAVIKGKDGEVDILNGTDLADTLIGGTGPDTLIGGKGNDLYTVDDLGDLVTEAENGGIDQVNTTLTEYELGAELENLTFTATTKTNFTGRGNELGNLIVGGLGDDLLDGAGGGDVLKGGLGNDRYIVDSASDVVSEAALQGQDTVWSYASSYTLGNNVEVLVGRLDDGQTLAGNALANIISGGAGNDLLKAGVDKLVDSLAGGLGDDVYHVSANDRVTEVAGQGTDTIVTADVTYQLTKANVENLSYDNGAAADAAFRGTGDQYDNVITGGSAGDTLNGGGGRDTLIGNGGNDTYLVDSADDVVIETDAKGGIDTVLSTATSYVLGDLVENLRYTGTGDFTGTGNAAANVITGGIGKDTLDGGGGIDSLVGGNGNDFYYADADDKLVELANQGIDSVETASASFTLAANVENLKFVGTGGFAGTGNDLGNEITGGDADDVLDGKKGADKLDGGAGDDTYYVDNIGDVLIDSDGHDTVRVALKTFTLADGFEDLAFDNGAAADLAFIGTGNQRGNVLTGGALGDTLDGGAGNDTLRGGKGNDLYLVDSSDDVVSEGVGEGTDTVRTTATSYSLSDNLENLEYRGTLAATLTGNALNNTLTGGSGDDTLSGMGGTDQLKGGDGDDIYVLDADSNDLVVELAGQGIDQVITSQTKHVLAANVENLTLVGNGASTAVGNAGANLIVGSDYDDSIDGAGGADVLQGRAGDDIYRVDTAGDSIVEEADGGVDTVLTKLANYTLADNVENLTIEATTSAKATGNAGSNILKTGGGADVLDGGEGADTMLGGAGNDTYVVDDIGDRILDSAGIDTIKTSLSLIDLTDGHEGELQYSGIDNVTYLGTESFSAFGNAAANTLAGGDGDDVLDGRGGKDLLIGGAGDDLYLVESQLDLISEAIDGGLDTVIAQSAIYSLATLAQVENLQIAATDDTLNISATGNDLDNFISYEQAVGSHTIDGKGGEDILRVTFARDEIASVTRISPTQIEIKTAEQSLKISNLEYILFTDSDELVAVPDLLQGKGSAFADTINGTERDDTINALAGDDTVFGLYGNDSLIGGDGNDTLDGGGDADRMAGGKGNDRYIVDDEGDEVVELSNEGVDWVEVSLATYDLAQNIEHLRFTGTDDFHGYGNKLANSLQGGAGNDHLDGGEDTVADTLIGGAGDDSYWVGAGDVVKEEAAGGHDRVFTDLSALTLASEVEDLIYVGEGNFTGVGNKGGNSLVGGAGNDVLQGFDGADLLYGGAGNDKLDGGVGNDTLEGGYGNDILTGGAGYDRFVILNGDGHDTVTDFVLGQDVLDLSWTGFTRLSQVIAQAEDIKGGGVTITIDGETSVTLKGTGLTKDKLNEYNVVVRPLDTADDGDDSLDGTDGADTIDGMGGDDLIYLGDGDDTGHGGDGDDQILGQAGNDTLVGGAGNDMLYGGGGDYSESGSGDDTFIGGAGDDVMVGGDGIDTVDYSGLTGGGVVIDVSGGTAVGEGEDLLDGIEVFIGSDQADSIDGSETSDDLDLRGRGGDDLLIGGWGDDTLDGGAGNDSLAGGDGADVLQGGEGDDRLLADRDDATVDGGAGFDWLDFSQSDDSVSVDLTQGSFGSYSAYQPGVIVDVEAVAGSSSDDELLGSAGDDVLAGNAGADLLDGRDGADSLFGGAGADILQGGLGDDHIDGGRDGEAEWDSEADIVSYGDAGAAVTVDLAAGTASGGDGNDTLVNVEAVRGSRHGDSLTGHDQFGSSLFGGDGNDLVTGGNGDDLLDGGGDPLDMDNGDDSLFGLGGDDQLRGGAGNDLLDGGDGDDDLDGGYGDDLLHGGAGDDTLTGGGGNDSLFGDAGNDFFRVDGSVATVVGGDGIDTVKLNAPGISSAIYEVENLIGSNSDDHLVGSSEANLLDGGYGDDILEGGAGDDWLVGGNGGDDTLTGGAGNDVFVVGLYEGDTVTITDFAAGDRLDLSGFHNLRMYHQLRDQITVVGGDTVITFGGSGYTPSKIVLKDFAGGADALSDADFIWSHTQIGTQADETIDGGALADWINGRDGDDLLQGGQGDDIYTYDVGSGGHDTIFDLAGSDSVHFADLGLSDLQSAERSGDDLVLSFTGGGTLTVQQHFAGHAVESLKGLKLGTSGNDSIVSTVADATLVGGAGDDLLKGGAQLNGGAGDDTLLGLSGSDVLIGGAGNDTLTGGADADLFVVEQGSGHDVVTDFELGTVLYNYRFGQDLVDLSGFSWATDFDTIRHKLNEVDGGVTLTIDSGTTIHLAGVGLADLAAEHFRFAIDYGTSLVEGSALADTLVGAEAADSLLGGGGNDLLIGFDGDDHTEAGTGNDIAEGGEGNDTIDGGAGRDTVIGGNGNDVLRGGPDDGDEGDSLFGDDGDDTLYGGAGGDRFDGGAGNDLIVDQYGANSVIGGAGLDTLDLGQGLLVRTEVDMTAGTAEIGLIQSTFTGIENIVTGAGDDKIIGDDQANTLNASYGDDSVAGGGGDDLIIGGRGNDTLSGGAGNDVFRFDRYFGYEPDFDYVTDLSGGDRIDIASYQGYVQDAASLDQALQIDDIDGLYTRLELGNDVIAINGTSWTAASFILGGKVVQTANTLGGVLGGDYYVNEWLNTLVGGSADDTLLGGGQSDTYVVAVGSGGDDLIHDTWGDNDRLKLLWNEDGEITDLRVDGDDLRISFEVNGNAAGSLVIDGQFTGEAVEQIYAVRGNANWYDELTLFSGSLGTVGSEASDVVAGSLADQTIDAGTGDDVVFASAGDDLVLGGAGADRLYGGDGDDRLDGGVDDDVLIGGAGNDTLTGGEGADTFQAGAGIDHVTDFTQGVDTIGMRGVLSAEYGSWTSLQNRISQVGGDTVIDLGDGRQMILDGFTGSLTKEDFYFNATIGTEGSDTVSANYDRDTLYGFGGDDLLDADGSILGGPVEGGHYGLEHDTLDGGAGNDTLYGGAYGDDELFGGTGNDLIFTGGKAVTVDGGAGVDTLDLSRYYWADYGYWTYYAANVDLTTGVYDGDNLLANIENATAFGTLIGNAGDNVLTGLAEVRSSKGYGSQLEGLAGNDKLIGSHAGDWLDGGTGNDSLSGGGGDDWLIGGLGDDWLNGGSARVEQDSWSYYFRYYHDAVDYGGATGAVVVNLGSVDLNDNELDDQNHGSAVAGWATGAAGNDVLRNIENIVGSAYGDRLTGLSNFSSTINAGLGNDTVTGGSEADQLFGEAGHDTLSGGAGNDYLDGAGGNDWLQGGDGDDYVTGGGGNDVMDGGAGNDTFSYVTVEDGAIDSIIGGAGTDRIDISGWTSMSFDDGADILRLVYRDYDGNEKSASIRFSGVEEFSLDGKAVMVGTTGSDTLTGTWGSDLIFGRAGNDTLIGDSGSNYIDGGSGDDLIYGDTAYHYSWDGSTLIGGDGSDGIYGAEGNDLISGGTGWNSLTGYGGHDTFLAGFGKNGIDGGDGFDTVDYSAAAKSIWASVQGGWSIDVGSTSTLIDFSDTLLNIERVIGSSHDDFLHGTFGVQTLMGGDGDDILVSVGDGDLLVGGNGSDTLQMLSSGVADLSLGTVVIANATDLISGFEVVIGGNGADTLIGSSGADTLFGGKGEDLLQGGAGNDVLCGGTLAYADDGANTLDGGAGRDFLFGSSGSDVFRISDLSGGPDVISGFGLGDKIDLTAFGIDAGALSSYLSVLADGSDLMLLFDASGSGSFNAESAIAMVAGRTTLDSSDFLL